MTFPMYRLQGGLEDWSFIGVFHRRKPPAWEGSSFGLPQNWYRLQSTGSAGACWQHFGLQSWWNNCIVEAMCSIVASRLREVVIMQAS